MNQHSPNSVNPSPDKVQLVQACIARLGAASKKNMAPEAFYRQVLDELLEFNDLVAVFIWMVTPTGLRLIGTSPIHSDPNTEDLQNARKSAYKNFLGSEERLLEDLETDDARLELLAADALHAAPYQSSSQRLLHDGDRAIVLEWVAQRSVDLQSPLFESLATAIGELAEDFHRNFELEKLRKLRRQDAELVALSSRLLEATQTSEIQFEIVNSAIDILEVDRVSLLESNDKRLQVVAVSGVNSLNQHSESIQLIQEYAEKGIKAGLPVRLQHDDAVALVTVMEIPERSETSSGTENRVRRILVLEEFEGAKAKTELDERASSLMALATSAFQRGEESHSIGVVPKVLSNNRFKWILGCVIAVLLILCLVPAKLKVRAEGQIRPQSERGLFAPTDGEIVQIKAQHNQQVNFGDVLVVMESPDLEFKLAELRGQQQATAEKIRAIEAQYAKGNDSTNRNPEKTFQDSTSIKELEILQTSQLKRLAILEDQKKSLAIRSPVTGRVVTWQLNDLLQGRQIKRGQRLLNIAVEKDGWLAEIQIRDYRMGHVLEQMESNAQLPTECMLVSSPDQRYSGKITSVAGTTSLNTEGMLVVNAIAQYDFAPDSELRSGAKVIATIDCGRRPLGYVYLYEFYHSISSYLF